MKGVLDLESVSITNIIVLNSKLSVLDMSQKELIQYVYEVYIDFCNSRYNMPYRDLEVCLESYMQARRHGLV